ncbi:MAG: HAMP domain-containing histidine kinase, partial [Muribaculaceae bacterium]|nr:HAMP domain-containing histidine kinase [Muribaculaceae bacterium]
VRDLSAQERQRMEIWADATREIVASFDSESTANIDFLLRIIESNTTIPVLLTDDNGNILQHRNFVLPEATDSLNPTAVSQANEQFLARKLATLAGSHNVIHINIAPGIMQHLYYEDSTVLKRLQFYPYVVVAVMIAFVMAVYFAVLSTKRAEQNKVWVGLSKETAHQLGTPISSLMAWMELLPDMGVDKATVAEMNKDVTRLSTIASRFSKIGSTPQIMPAGLNDAVGTAASYMSTRVSQRIRLSFIPAPEQIQVELCTPLFEWVMENLIKNAVDAMDGRGSIDITTGIDGRQAYVEVSDTGKGIPRKNQKRVFSPGYTTKKRGWGLGLTLARRIINQYHRGDIFVKTSSPSGTTFRINLPLISQQPLRN